MEKEKNVKLQRKMHVWFLRWLFWVRWLRVIGVCVGSPHLCVDARLLLVVRVQRARRAFALACLGTARGVGTSVATALSKGKGGGRDGNERGGEMHMPKSSLSECNHQTKCKQYGKQGYEPDWRR